MLKVVKIQYPSSLNYQILYITNIARLNKKEMLKIIFRQLPKKIYFNLATQEMKREYKFVTIGL